MKQWYVELFENYANQYEKEPFIKGTIGEVDFIEKEIQFNKNFKILDIGCGTGRHSIELAKRGYKVIGVDLSEAQLRKARENAKISNTDLTFIQDDARNLSFSNAFDLVLMICEGGFPLMETDEMNYEILKSAARAIKPGGTFIFTTLNGLYPIFHSVKDFINSHYDKEVSKANSFDLMTFRDNSEIEFVDDNGSPKKIYCTERYYIPSEITWLLKSLNFYDIKILGCEIGNWTHNKKLTVDDFEMLVVSKMKSSG